MKKTLLICAGLVASLYAASNEEILRLYSNLPEGVSIKVASRSELPDLKGYEMVVLELSKGNFKQKEIVFTKDDAIFPEIINTKTGESYKDTIERKATAKALANVLKNEDAKNIIKLGNDPKKETLLIVTDADCPFCRREMSQIDERLKEYNLDIVMASVHGRDGHVKSHLIYQDIKNAKTDSEKLKILRKYYDPNFVAKKVSDEELKPTIELANKYFSAGVNAVPFIINKKELQ